MQTDFIYDSTLRFLHVCAFEGSRYTGKERDAESGLDYFGARYMSSSMGRFMSGGWPRSDFHNSGCPMSRF